MEINELIRNRRLELGLTLKEVATALNVAESTVSRYESNDIHNMGIDKIEALAKVLECSPAYLMGWNLEIATNNELPRIMKYYNSLNAIGKQEAEKRIEELSYVDKYKDI